jgi:hypothetical protein
VTNLGGSVRRSIFQTSSIPASRRFPLLKPLGPAEAPSFKTFSRSASNWTDPPSLTRATESHLKRRE